jgi:hypothetical protein
MGEGRAGTEEGRIEAPARRGRRVGPMTRCMYTPLSAAEAALLDAAGFGEPEANSNELPDAPAHVVAPREASCSSQRSATNHFSVSSITERRIAVTKASSSTRAPR